MLTDTDCEWIRLRSVRLLACEGALRHQRGEEHPHLATLAGKGMVIFFFQYFNAMKVHKADGRLNIQLFAQC